MKGIILAAGKGSRLRPWTDNTPKPLLTIAGKPILDYIMTGFADSGVTELALVIGYLGDMVEAHYGAEFLGMKLKYYRQTELLGTGHALLYAEKDLEDSIFMLSFGDLMLDRENYANLAKFHTENAFDATITLNPTNDPYAGAAVYLDGKRVVTMIEKPPKDQSKTYWNNRGLFMFTPAIFKEVHDLKLSTRGEYDLPTAVDNLAQHGGAVGAMAVTGFSSDIGTKEEFAIYEKYMIEKR